MGGFVPTGAPAASKLAWIQQVAQRVDSQTPARLLPLLHDPDIEVRREAARALDACGWRPTDDHERALRAMALGRFEEVLSLGAAAVGPLRSLLGDSLPANRLAALEMLLQLRDVSVEEALAVALRDEQPAIRLVAIQGLGRTAGARAGPLLAGLIADPDPEVRAAVLEALTPLGGPFLHEAASRFLTDARPEVRRQAVEVLGQVGGVSAASALAQALLDAHGPVRDAAWRALSALEPGWERSEAVQPVIAALQDACRTGNPESRLAAREILKRLGREPAFAPGQLSSQQLSAILALSSSLQAPNRDLRHAAVEALGRMGDPRAVVHLTRAMQDPDECVRRAAVYALDALGWEPANYQNLAWQAVILGRWDVAGACGEEAVSPLMLALRSLDPEVQAGAARCLGDMNGARAVEALPPLLCSPVDKVCRAAAQALSGQGWEPPDAASRIRLALALGKWNEAARHGECSVRLLVERVKQTAPQSEASQTALQALAAVDDPQAVEALLASARDGQVAAAAVHALQRILEFQAARVDERLLGLLSFLTNIVQFQYAIDPRFGTPVRTALQEVDTLRICELAQREAARRRPADSPDA